MAFTTHSLQLFGLDLGRAWQEAGPLLRSLQHSRLLSWLTPDLPVHLLRADGTAAHWQGAQALTTAPKAVHFEALEISEDLLLRKTLALPLLPEAQTLQALALQARESSPFAPEDQVWGYRLQAPQRTQVAAELVLGSRTQIQAFIDTQSTRRSLPQQPCEAWALASDQTPIVLPGWGEETRRHAARQQRHKGYGLLALGLGLAAAIAITPTAQLRLRALEAAYAYDALLRQTAPLIGQREAYLHTIERLDAVRSLLQGNTDALRLLETLTSTLPDDTYIHHLKVQGLKVTLQGMTPNAAKLLQSLGTLTGIKEAKAPTAAVRNPGATLDSFVIELQLDPALLSQAPASAPLPAPAAPDAATASPLPASPPPASPPPTSTAPASPSAQTPPAAPTIVPPAVTTAPHKSRFSSGD